MTNTSIIRSRILELLQKAWPDGMTDAELAKAVPATRERIARIRLRLKKNAYVRASVKRGKLTVWLVDWETIDMEKESIRRAFDSFDQATQRMPRREHAHANTEGW
jgi:DNA-binding IclR family transcriptional regulator